MMTTKTRTEAVEEFYHKHYRLLRWFIFKCGVHEDSDIDDVCQEVCLRMLVTPEPIKHIKRLMYKIAKDESNKHINESKLTVCTSDADMDTMLDGVACYEWDEQQQWWGIQARAGQAIELAKE